jgi:hypothetical protein
MLKFNSTVINSSNAQSNRIISLAHDELIVISGNLMKCVPLFQKGTSFEELKKALGKIQDDELSKFIALLRNHSLLEESADPSVSKDDILGAFDFGSNGSVSIETLQVMDVSAIIGIKAIREICGGLN